MKTLKRPSIIPLIVASSLTMASALVLAAPRLLLMPIAPKPMGGAMSQGRMGSDSSTTG
jgi:hypothetical protein